MREVLLAVCLLLALPVCSQDKEYHGDGIDDYLRFAPIAAVYTLKASGVESASSWKRLVVNTATSYALSVGVGYGLKKTISERRPDGTDHDAFPSGHAIIAFAGAHILHKEYHHVSPWISVAGYGVAAFTAYDRVRRNRHEWHDVIAGAAIGVLGTEAGYWIGDKLTGEHSQYNVSVSPNTVSVIVNF